MITIETGHNKFICVIKDTEEESIKIECPNCDTRRFYMRGKIDHCFFNSKQNPIIQLKCDCNAEIQVIGKTELLDKEILEDLV